MQDKIFRQAALEKLSSPEELDQLMQVTTPRGWFALIALIILLAVAVIIGVFTVIPIRATAAYCLLVNNATTQNISGILYLPYGATTQPIISGDAAQISLADRSGFLLGTVTSVSDFPVSDTDMMTVLNNRTLVDQLLNDNGSLIEAQVALKPDADTPGAYQWSTGQSAGVTVQDKLRCDASITVDQKHPVQLILRGS